MAEFLAAPRSIDNFFLTPNPCTSSPQPPPIAVVLHLSPPWLHLPKPCAECFIGRCYYDVFQLIKAHQAARLPPVEEVKTVLHHSIRGFLSTYSQKYDGYPSGSMVDFACDVFGSPILVVSSLAVHTKDLLANSKCSLLVPKYPEDHRTDFVIIVHGDAVPVPNEERDVIGTAYLARHPEAFWVDFGDFQFMRLEPKDVKFVSGVATALFGSGEFTKEEFAAAKVDHFSKFSKPVTSHMNKDHSDNTKLMVHHSTLVPAGYQGRDFKLRILFPNVQKIERTLAMLGFIVQHNVTGKGAFDNLLQHL